MQYDPSNIFSKILRGEIPSRKLHEDDDALVIMDAFPQARGHALVIPKSASRNLLDADPQVLSRLMPLIQRVAVAVQKATKADGIRIAQFNEAPAGQTVFHLHFHIIPAYEGTGMNEHGASKGDDAEMDELADAISNALSR